jgi:hypothetical protein
VRRYLKRRINQRRPFEQRYYIKQIGVDFDQRLLIVRPRRNFYLEGYWQSEDYFKDVEATIRQELQIQPPTDEINIAMAERIRSHKAVAVHVRFFDEHKATVINNTPTDYYSRAIAEIVDRVPDAHFYLFSDRPETARARIPLPDALITPVFHNQGDAMAYADLWLMTLCRHFIIANSTFSWWGAWLAAHPDKFVIAPGFKMQEGMMSWGFEGLLPKSWVKL